VVRIKTHISLFPSVFIGSGDSNSQGNCVCLTLNIILLILLYQDWQEGNNTLLRSSLHVFIQMKNGIVITSLSLHHVGLRHQWTATLNQKTITQRFASEPYKHLNLFLNSRTWIHRISKHYFPLSGSGMKKEFANYQDMFFYPSIFTMSVGRKCSSRL